MSLCTRTVNTIGYSLFNEWDPINEISYLTCSLHYTQKKRQPQHWELNALLFMNGVWVLQHPTLTLHIIYIHGRYLWDRTYCTVYIVLIQEDWKVKPNTDVTAKAALPPQLFLRPWLMVRPVSNSQPPAWQPNAQPTEPPGH